MGMSLRDFGGSVVVEVRSNCDQRAVEAVGGRDKVLSSTLLPEAILTNKNLERRSMCDKLKTCVTRRASPKSRAHLNLC